MPLQVSIGPFSVNSYTLCIALGAFLGAAWILLQLQGATKPSRAALNALLVIGIASMLAGRLGYVLLNSAYFTDHITEAITMTNPGFSEQTAILGGVTGWAIAARWRQQIDGRWLALLATLIGMGAFLGCIPHGCAYGREVYWTESFTWQLRVDWPDAYSIANPRLPSQLFTLIWLIVCCAVVLWISNRQAATCQPPALTQLPAVPIWLALFAAGDFALQFLRADPMVSLAGLRVPQWLDLALLFVGCAWMAIARFAGSHKVG